MTPRRRVLLISCASILFLNCVGAALLAAVISRTMPAQAAKSQRRIVYGLTLMPSGFDPHINSSSELGIPLRSVYDTLVYRDPVSKAIVPGLAEQVSVSGDGLTYTFKLKSGVTFHDGTPFDAMAVAANLDRITNPETQSQKALLLLGPYNKYVVVDPMTIQIVLKTPYAPLLDGLAQVYLGIASPTALKAYDRERYQLHQVGTGPYSMVEYVPGDHLLLRRNPDYRWGPSFYDTNNPAPLDEIEFRFFQDAATRAPALESGSAQVMGEILPADALVLTRNPDITLVPQKIPGLPFQFFFNTTLAPTDNVDLRRALIQATNRTAITDSVFQQFSPPAYGPLSETTLFYDARVKQVYPYDSEKTLQAFLKAGYSYDTTNKVLVKDNKPLTLVMIVPTWSLAPQIAQKIQTQWRETGIQLELRQVPTRAALLDEFRKNAYHLLAFNDQGVDPSVMNTFYLSTGPNNFSKYADGNLDNLLMRSTMSSDPVERQNLYTEIQGTIMTQALLLPIRDYVNLNAYTKQITNLKFDAYGWFPLLANVQYNNGE